MKNYVSWPSLALIIIAMCGLIIGFFKFNNDDHEKIKDTLNQVVVSVAIIETSITNIEKNQKVIDSRYVEDKDCKHSITGDSARLVYLEKKGNL